MLVVIDINTQKQIMDYPGKVILYGTHINEVLRIVHDLRASGLIQGVDFEFEYKPEIIADLFETNGQFEGIVRPKQTIFRFAQDSIATWFMLKYQ